MLQKLKCFFGWHWCYRPTGMGFFRRCKYCKKLWQTNYFDWRAGNFSGWYSVTPDDLNEVRLKAYEKVLQGDNADQTKTN